MRLAPLNIKHKNWITELLGSCFPDDNNSWKALTSWYNENDNGDNVVTVLEHMDMFYSAVTYTLSNDECLLHAVCVPEELRRQGYGTRAVRRLIRALGRGKNQAQCVKTQAQEDNLPAQLFLKSLEFKCLDPRQQVYTAPTGKTYYLFTKELAIARSTHGR